MLNKIIRVVNKHHLEDGTPDDTAELVAELRKHYVDEAINELIDDNQYIVIASKFFIKVARGTFTKFAELQDSSKHLHWEHEWVLDVLINDGYTNKEMNEIINDLIIRNDLLTTN